MTARLSVLSAAGMSAGLISSTLIVSPAPLMTPSARVVDSEDDGDTVPPGASRPWGALETRTRAASMWGVRARLSGTCLAMHQMKKGPDCCVSASQGPICVRGRYWVRTSDLFGVNEARYHCANRPLERRPPYPTRRTRSPHRCPGARLVQQVRRASGARGLGLPGASTQYP